MQVWRIARITFLEAIRKKDFYALLILLGVYGAVAKLFLTVQPENEEIPRLLFSLGLTFSFAASAILVVVLASRQVGKEIEQGTILPLMARPVTRGQFLFGKFLACWLIGLFSLLCFVALILLLVPRPEPFGGLLFLQVLVLKAGALAALAALTLMLSLVLPESFTVTLALGYYFLWGIAFPALQAGLNLAGGFWETVLGRALYLLPHLEVLNVSRLWMGLGLLVAYNVFERRWI
jgi:ABC-type transport system involved in multi-copper enzyme maturation permease subunit